MGRFGLLGETLSHTFSPEIHAMLGGYEYNIYEVPRDGLDDFLRARDFDGVNVTIPYKQDVIPYCTTVSDTVRATGAVNVLIRGADGALHGDNTDYYGFSYMARAAGVDFAGKKTLVLGSGGTSLTVCAVVRDRGGTPVVISRGGADNYDNLDRHSDAEILVNTTPVGMYPHTDAAPVDLALFPALEAVLDVVYNPRRTRLLLQAERLGLRCAGGLRMLVAQAKRASELFQGIEISDSETERILRRLEKKMLSIVLIGMPGCGKTTVGALVAQALGRELCDLDEEIVRRAGMPIPEIFASKGEVAFRVLEAELAQTFGARSGIVLATGGGVVKNPANYDRLKQNGAIVWMTRELDKLDQDGRPLSVDDAAVRRLYAEREPLYRAFADETIDNNGAPEQAADAIARCFDE